MAKIPNSSSQMQVELAERIRRGRLREGLTQAALGVKLGVGQAAVAHWEAGKARPTKAKLGRLEAVLGPLTRANTRNPTGRVRYTETDLVPTSDVPAYGVWLRRAREEANKSVPELATAAGVSPLTIYNIEGGKAQNPQISTRQKLEKALNKKAPPEIIEDISREQKIEGLGELIDFDPHDKQGWPVCRGVYVLYDVSQRPIYVGKAGTTISARLDAHYEKFWFREPIIKHGSFIEIQNKELRHQVEQVLIKFSKSNAVIK